MSVEILCRHRRGLPENLPKHEILSLKNLVQKKLNENQNAPFLTLHKYLCVVSGFFAMKLIWNQLKRLKNAENVVWDFMKVNQNPDTGIKINN